MLSPEHKALVEYVEDKGGFAPGLALGPHVRCGKCRNCRVIISDVDYNCNIATFKCKLCDRERELTGVQFDDWSLVL